MEEIVEDVYGQYFDAGRHNKKYERGEDETDSECFSDNEAFLSADNEEESDFNCLEPEVQIRTADSDDSGEDVKKTSVFNCGCTQAAGNTPCSALFDPEELNEMRREARELDYYDSDHCNRLDVVILGQLRALCCDSKQLKRSHKTQVARKRNRTTYRIKGEVVCKRTFFYSFDISKNRFSRLLKIYNSEGVCEKPHGGTKNKNAVHTSEPVIQNVIQFLRNYAVQHALFLPSRMAHTREVAVKLLPCGETEKHVHQVYRECTEIDACKALPLSTFRKLWKTFCPEIVFQKPTTDLCDFCQKNFANIYKLSGKTDAEKLEQIMAMKEHLENANEERKYYNELISRSKVDPGFGVFHFSFDMAQEVFLPSNPLQPSSLYFSVPFRVGIFGVTCDTMEKQVNYLLPESIVLAKDSNTIVNLLYHNFLVMYAILPEISLHVDNCIGQDEHSLVLYFLNFLILTESYKKIELHSLNKGHTRFSCDRCYGLFKKKYRSCTCSTLDELKRLVEESTPESRTNQAVIVGNEAGDLLIEMYDWVNFFQRQNWKKGPLITSYSHFMVSDDHPGVLYCRKNLDDEPVKFFLGQLSLPEARPDSLYVNRFARERQAYLYKELRQFCPPEVKDILCPEPSPLDEPAGESCLPSQENGAKISSEEEIADEPKISKPKRGRPKKNSASEIAEQNCPVPVKCGRGRPPKSKSLKEE